MLCRVVFVVVVVVWFFFLLVCLFFVSKFVFLVVFLVEYMHMFKERGSTSGAGGKAKSVRSTKTNNMCTYFKIYIFHSLFLIFAFTTKLTQILK